MKALYEICFYVLVLAYGRTCYSLGQSRLRSTLFAAPSLRKEYEQHANGFFLIALSAYALIVLYWVYK